ncbi:phosphoribosyltransferase, partial [Streptomyces sp. 2A115]|uniref:phosphoribosyltransferase n=1 Tax=Streptomyces sp. 2A115 TaxID=3457439 RepID=UPI003FCFB815
MRFHDRRHAGEVLAAALSEWAEGHEVTDPVVLALPRGGVPVAAVIARALNAPLDVLIARKIGLPRRPETGIGAVAGEDPPVFDQATLALLGMTEYQFATEVARQRDEVHRLEELYRQGRPAAPVRDRTVIVVDDGLATGVTARAALIHLRRQSPARLVLAVPVGSAGGVAQLQEADEVICPHRPRHFGSVGEWYDDFGQLADREVTETL